MLNNVFTVYFHSSVLIPFLNHFLSSPSPNTSLSCPYFKQNTHTHTPFNTSPLFQANTCMSPWNVERERERECVCVCVCVCVCQKEREWFCCRRKIHVQFYCQCCVQTHSSEFQFKAFILSIKRMDEWKLKMLWFLPMCDLMTFLNIIWLLVEICELVDL